MAPLRIGVLIENVQLTDITCIDLLGNLSTSYISTCNASFGNAFAHLTPLATAMEFLYISSTLSPATMTPHMQIVPTHTYDDAPRDLDILVIGGPPLTHRPATSIKFLKEAAKETKVVMTTCVGALWLADAGVLDHKRATTNRGFLAAAKQLHPQVEWVDQRWVTDTSGTYHLWTAGGAGAGEFSFLSKGLNGVKSADPVPGIDMLATYVMQNFNEEIVRAAWEALDVDPTVRGQFYKKRGS